MKYWLCVLSIFIFSSVFSQVQTCPANINFSSHDLTHWAAYTGNNRNGNGPTAILQNYDSTKSLPWGTVGIKTIYEYGLSGTTGIQVISAAGTDIFGGFSTIPTINGYQYNYSILLGSTTVSYGSAGQQVANGGYIRGISYRIFVPPGATNIPYTM